MRTSVFKRLLAASVGLSALLATAPAIAGPTVTETTTGSPGAWVYNFSITNTLGGNNSIYFFGVQDPSGSISGTPANWEVWNPGFPWSNAAEGGSSNVYNLNWIAAGNPGIAPGTTLDGFDVLDTSADAITSFNWFAYAYGGTYSGEDHFWTSANPGFEGTTGAGAVPEPATWAMMLLGFGAIGFGMRRNRQQMSFAQIA